MVETEVKIASQPSTFQRVWMILPSPQRIPACDIDICVLFMSVPCHSQWVLSTGTVADIAHRLRWLNTPTAWWLLSLQGLKNRLYPKTNTGDKRRAMKPGASSCKCLSSKTLHDALHGICLVIQVTGFWILWGPLHRVLLERWGHKGIFYSHSICTCLAPQEGEVNNGLLFLFSLWFLAPVGISEL